ncbi:hypothetical protein RCL1_003054 [Eukaryota sp. TZLM3-RCL]
MLERPLLTLVLRNLISSSLSSRTGPKIIFAETLHKFSYISCSFRSITIHVVTLVFSSEQILIPLNDLFFSSFVSNLDFNSNLSIRISLPSFTCPFLISRIKNIELINDGSSGSTPSLFQFSPTFNFPFLNSLTISALCISQAAFSDPSPFFSSSLRKLVFHRCVFPEEVFFGDIFKQITDLSIILDSDKIPELTLIDLSNLCSLIKLEIRFCYC